MAMMMDAGESRSPARALRRLAGAAVAAVLLRRTFSPSKCKTEARMATARMKLLRNRREAQVRQMRRDIAALLRDRQEDTARIRVEHVIREQNIMAANEIIELFCELIVTRLPIIAKQKECPADLKEGICSLIFAAPRCSDLPELGRMRDIFEKKYGKDFVSAAVDLRPDAAVNNLLIEKLSVKKPSGQTKLKILKEIAKEHQIDWDTTESEQELLKPPEELIQGPNSFVEASNMPVKTTLKPYIVQPNPANFSSRYSDDEYHNGDAPVKTTLKPRTVQPNPVNFSSRYSDDEYDHGDNPVKTTLKPRTVQPNPVNFRYSDDEYDNEDTMHFKDAASAARAAAESAERAASAAKAAADFVSKTSCAFDEAEDCKRSGHASTQLSKRQSMSNSIRSSKKEDEDASDSDDLKPPHGRKVPSRLSFSGSNHMEEKYTHPEDLGTRRIMQKRSSRATRKVHSEIKFDDSEGFCSETEDENDVEVQSVERLAPPTREPFSENRHSEEGEPDHDFPELPKANLHSRVHPNMPLDYETLTARFEALKSSGKHA